MTMTETTSSTPPVSPVPEDQIEKYSSAVTLSDMEIFIFPELLYSLVLANIMSPRLWTWRENAWFAGIEKLKPYRRVLRLKQFVIDNYEFNLDLDTWGLTTKEAELARFGRWMNEQTIGQSNALFGYEGDKYYFDLDIRRHFGLDKYNSNIIPYWKTETVEAMDAFRFKKGFSRGAGECVSLSTLYAAALFVVCRIPLRDIFLMATPLHSQNFIALNEGVLTNNRRIVTKNMWFNGTEQTAKAQRALRHEQVTIVAHHTGYIHCVYPDATIAPDEYRRFQASLRDFMTTEITMEILANFLRDSSQHQKCFQIMHDFHGSPRYIAAEKVYAYEHASSFKVSDATRDKLLAEIDEDDFFTEPLEGRMLLNKFDDFFKAGGVDISNQADLDRLAAALDCQCHRAAEVIARLVDFARHEPRFPDRSAPRNFVQFGTVDLSTEMTREQVIRHLQSSRTNPVVDLSFYAYRDMTRTDWTPFLTAALERNPVSIHGARETNDDAVIAHLERLAGESIYEGPRLAQPDEVWNYGRGDGIERAICLANIFKARHPGQPFRLEAQPESVRISCGSRTLTWPSSKMLQKRLDLT
jgi:hypothetical protein